MNIIVCLDDNKGMLFNNRRQSRDKAVLSDVFNEIQGEKLYIMPFSEKLMAEYCDKVTLCEDASALQGGQWFFCENVDLTSFADKIEKLVVYKWNRVYPADFNCNLDFSLFNLKSEIEFEGNSHPVITKQTFAKG